MASARLAIHVFLVSCLNNFSCISLLPPIHAHLGICVCMPLHAVRSNHKDMIPVIQQFEVTLGILSMIIAEPMNRTLQHLSWKVLESVCISTLPCIALTCPRLALTDLVIVTVSVPFPSSCFMFLSFWLKDIKINNYQCGHWMIELYITLRQREYL